MNKATITVNAAQIKLLEDYLSDQLNRYHSEMKSDICCYSCECQVDDLLHQLTLATDWIFYQNRGRLPKMPSDTK